MSKRPRIEGYAIVSREGMIAKSDGSFPEELKIPADQQFYQESLDRASAVANGRHSAEGGPKEKGRKRILVTRLRPFSWARLRPSAGRWRPPTPGQATPDRISGGRDFQLFGEGAVGLGDHAFAGNDGIAFDAGDVYSSLIQAPFIRRWRR